MRCCKYGETTLCFQGCCDECAYRQQHDEAEHEREMEERARYEMLFDPTSDLYYTDGAVAMRADAGMD